jgi:two-component system, LuxR family, sensor kinase FixL
MHNENNGECAVMLRESALADRGELAGPLTHEINNLLNMLTLHLALVQQRSPADLTPDVLAIRQHVTQAADVVLRFQRYGGKSASEPDLVDLNTALREVVEALPNLPPHAPVVLELDPALPRVRAYEADLRRLGRFLVTNALRALPPTGPAVMVRTRAVEGGVVLQVEDSGPEVAPEAVPQLFEPGGEPREGMCRLEMAACRSIVRRLNGKLQAQPRPGGGLIISAALPVASLATKR